MRVVDKNGPFEKEDDTLPLNMFNSEYNLIVSYQSSEPTGVDLNVCYIVRIIHLIFLYCRHLNVISSVLNTKLSINLNLSLISQMILSSGISE